MKVIMDPEFEKRGEWAKMVRAAIPLVEKLLGKSASRVTVRLDFEAGASQGKPFLRVGVSDELAGPMFAFSDASSSYDWLKSPEAIKERIYQDWRHLMDLAFEKNLDYLKANVPTE